MVSSFSLVCMTVSFLLAVLVPVGLVVYFYRKEKISLRAVLTGALVMIVFQFLTRIPLLTWLGGQAWYQNLSERSFLFSAVLVGGLSAGLFEETGRYLGFRYFLKRERSWKNGVAFGIGHGGIEAVVLVGLAQINNIVLSMMINSGTYDSFMAPQLDAVAAAQLKSQLTGIAPLLFLAGGLERVMALVIQIALSLVVLYGVMNRKIVYLVYAILLHALVNAPTVIMGEQEFGVWTIELYVLIMAIAAGLFIIRSRTAFE